MFSMRISKTGYTNLQRELLSTLRSTNARKGMNQIILDAANKYVPTRSGALRRATYVKPSEIGWTAPYAHYQHEGVVYGPNLPGWIGNKGVFRSPAHKYPTGRELGANFAITWLPAKFVWDEMGYRKADKSTPPVPVRFGYSTPGTKHHWLREAWEHDSRSINNKITRYLKGLVRGRH